jgi:phage shock protein E
VSTRPSAGRLLLAAVGSATLLLLAGCGADERVDSGAPAAQQPATGGSRVVTAAEGLRLAARQETVVLDVRTPEEYAAGHLEGARNLPLADAFAAAVEDLPREGSYVLYCRTGNRSAQAAKIMADAGFTDVADAGGLETLAAAGGRVVT